MKLTCLMLLASVTAVTGFDAEFQSSAARQEAAASSPVAVRTWASRTAVWVGDHVTYVIELDAAPEVEILTDDLDRSRLRLEGLEILDATNERDASVSGRVTHRARYTIATYQIDAPVLRIAPIPVRYSVRRPGQRREDALPAGEVMVPALNLAWRSTIAASHDPVAIRDGRSVQTPRALVRLAQPIGIGLLLLAAAPVALAAVDLLRRVWRTGAQRRKRRTRRQRRKDFEDIKALDVATPAKRREAYARLDAWIREEVEHATGIAAAALTAGEVPRAVPQTSLAIPLENLQRLLAGCERAKYAPDPPPVDEWDTTLADAEQLLERRQR